MPIFALQLSVLPGFSSINLTVWWSLINAVLLSPLLARGHVTLGLSGVADSTPTSTDNGVVLEFSLQPVGPTETQNGVYPEPSSNTNTFPINFPEDDGPSAAILIGASTGGSVAGAILIAVAIWYFIRRRRRARLNSRREIQPKEEIRASKSIGEGRVSQNDRGSALFRTSGHEQPNSHIVIARQEVPPRNPHGPSNVARPAGLSSHNFNSMSYPRPPLRPPAPAPAPVPTQAPHPHTHQAITHFGGERNSDALQGVRDLVTTLNSLVNDPRINTLIDQEARRLGMNIDSRTVSNRHVHEDSGLRTSSLEDDNDDIRSLPPDYTEQ